MKIALVHDYLSQDGGAERVLQAFHRIWPNAPIFVLFHDKKQIPQFTHADIRESFISMCPFGRKKYQWYLPLMPLATESHDLSEFDVVLSSTSAFAKGVITKPHTLHISYCHTPTRYLWSDTHSYIEELRYNKFIKSLLPRVMHRMRLWDKSSVDRVDYFIANSETVRARIDKYYRRSSDVIYPPIDANTFFISDRIGDYFVGGGRMVPYKRFDLIIRTFNRLGFPLKLFGTGPELSRLQRIAKSNIEFVGKISDTEKALLLSRAKAFIHPQIEDLGITPLESMASGRPVIAYPVGGVSETVIPGVTGTFFTDQRWESLFDVVQSFDADSWNPRLIREHAMRFDVDQFTSRIQSYVEDQFFKFQRNQRVYISDPSLYTTVHTTPDDVSTL